MRRDHERQRREHDRQQHESERAAGPVWLARVARGAADWELNRRAGYDYDLLPPEAAIDPSEDAVSIDAAAAMRDQFAQDSPAVREFFDALVDLLTGVGRKQ